MKLAMLSACLLSVAGCTLEADETVNDFANGRHVQLNRGQVFDIVLADDYATSHCQWRDEQTYDSAILQNLGARYQPGRTPPAGAGGGTYTSRYKAVGAGTVHVTLLEEDNANPRHVARRFAMDVTVRR